MYDFLFGGGKDRGYKGKGRGMILIDLLEWEVQKYTNSAPAIVRHENVALNK